MEQRSITAGRSYVCWEVSELTKHTCHSRPSPGAGDAHQRRATWTWNLNCPSSTRETFVSLKNPKGRESIQTCGPRWPTRHNMNSPAPLCHALFREQRHKENLMCMDFLLTVIRLSGGLYSMCEDLELQTAVIETDSGLSTMTLWITTIINPIIIAAALHATQSS